MAIFLLSCYRVCMPAPENTAWMTRLDINLTRHMIMLELIAKYHKLPPMHKTPSYSQLKRSDTLSGYTQSLQVFSIHREGTYITKVWICFLNSSKSPVFKFLQHALLIPASVSMEFRLESLHPRPRRACLLLGAQGAG